MCKVVKGCENGQHERVKYYNETTSCKAIEKISSAERRKFLSLNHASQGIRA